MKAKHNKKRNTAFIFEALSQEMTKAIIDKNEDRRADVTKIVATFFRKGTDHINLQEARALCSEIRSSVRTAGSAGVNDFPVSLAARLTASWLVSKVRNATLK